MTLDEMLTVLTTPPRRIPTVSCGSPRGSGSTDRRPDATTSPRWWRTRIGLSAERFLALRRERGASRCRPTSPEGTARRRVPVPEDLRVPEGGPRRARRDRARCSSSSGGGRGARARGQREGARAASLRGRGRGLDDREGGGVDDDGPLISGVIYNRLERGHAARDRRDAPVRGSHARRRALDTPTSRPTTRTTPASTRAHADPDREPGAEALAWPRSIRRHASSSTTCSADGDGGHRFAETYDEHLRTSMRASAEPRRPAAPRGPRRDRLAGRAQPLARRSTTPPSPRSGWTGCTCRCRWSPGDCASRGRGARQPRVLGRERHDAAQGGGAAAVDRLDRGRGAAACGQHGRRRARRNDSRRTTPMLRGSAGSSRTTRLRPWAIGGPGLGGGGAARACALALARAGAARISVAVRDERQRGGDAATCAVPLGCVVDRVACRRRGRRGRGRGRERDSLGPRWRRAAAPALPAGDARRRSALPAGRHPLPACGQGRRRGPVARRARSPAPAGGALVRAVDRLAARRSR